MPDSQGKQQACKLSPFSQFHWGLCWETTAFQTLLRNVSFLPLRAQLSSLSLLFDPTPAGIRNRNKSSEVMCYSSGSRQWLRGTLPNGDMMTKRRNSWFKERKKNALFTSLWLHLCIRRPPRVLGNPQVGSLPSLQAAAVAKAPFSIGWEKEREKKGKATLSRLRSKLRSWPAKQNRTKQTPPPQGLWAGLFLALTQGEHQDS